MHRLKEILSNLSQTAIPPDLRPVLARIPALADICENRHLSWTRLGGGNHNTVVLVRAPGRPPLAVRLPRPRARARNQREIDNLRRAAAVGVAPRAHHFDLDDGLLAYDYVAGDLLTRERLAEPGGVEALAETLVRLHAAPAFTGSFHLWPVIDPRLDDLARAAGPDTPDLGSALFTVGRLRPILDATAPPPAPCHCDPICANVIDSAEGLRLIDWQVSGMSDPDLEIGEWIVNGRLDPAATDRFLAACYGDAHALGAERARLFAAVSCFAWMCRHARDLARDPEDPEALRRRLRRRLRLFRGVVRDPAWQAARDAVTAHALRP